MSLQIPPLSSYGIQDQDVPTFVEKVSRASSTKGNPIALTMDELREVLTSAL
jgi:alcohol dehydrogenase class IV